MPALQLVCHPTWMRDEMATADIELHHSFGLEIPYFGYEDIWWMPQGFAVELNKALSAYGRDTIALIAPGADLLPSVPVELTKRTIEVLTVADAIENPRSGWWKSAEAKIDTFASQYRTETEIVADVLSSKLPMDAVLHYTSTVLDIAREFRSFIADGKVLTTSVYLVSEDGEQTTVYDGAQALPGDIELVKSFLNILLTNVDVPPSVVVDVAILQDGTLALLEFNPSWCSAWYDNDMNAVVESISAGFNLNPASLEIWGYAPDPYFEQKLSRKALLPQR